MTDKGMILGFCAWVGWLLTVVFAAMIGNWLYGDWGMIACMTVWGFGSGIRIIRLRGPR